ncbi:MAG: M23 family metallopeptidase [Cyclobacteriaceae bacterium]|nr:M23 family metallopeptidase [Cyclobacteriaceae bacterium]MCH8515612.1 M23 family metallopeptidase [Cyclobacteriaceae bacterium]
MRNRKTLTNWLNSRYVLVVRDEESFAEKTTYNFTYAKVILIIVGVFILFFALSMYATHTFLAQWFNPRQAELESNRKLIALTMAIDSLENEVNRKTQFIDNFQSILRGDREVYYDITSQRDQDTSVEGRINDLNRETEFMNTRVADSVFRQNFEQSGFELNNLNSRRNVDFGSENLQDLYLFSPISGIVSSPFNLKIDHYGVDIVAKDNEPVKSIAEGTVLFAAWTIKDGYVIAVQHRANLVSVYKHNSALLKSQGDYVSAGEVISIIGNSGEMTTGQHLHFEIWYNGKAINPEEFITF